MAYWVYVLYSENSARYYCGSTSNLEKKIAQHNHPDFDAAKTTTRFKGPWDLVWSEEMNSKTEALKRERWIKKRGIKRFLENASGC